MRLVFATNNAHKLEEARAILGESVEILSLNDIGCHDDIPETSDTLDGNSRQKARYVYDRYGVDCFADDTGLEVEALDGRPGVYSARYAGEPADSTANRHKLLQELEGVTNRKAHFRTVVTLILGGKEYQFEERVNGRIDTYEHGEGGFGYDSLFIPDGYDLTFAELPPETKNAISHRAKALRIMDEWTSGRVDEWASGRVDSHQ